MGDTWRWGSRAVGQTSLLPDYFRRGPFLHLSARSRGEDRLSSGADPSLDGLIVMPVESGWGNEVPCKVGHARSPDRIGLGEGADEGDGRVSGGAEDGPSPCSDGSEVTDLVNCG